VLELTALPSIKESDWIPVVRETDALLVWVANHCICVTGCGNPDWADVLATLGNETVYVGVSGGSMVVAPNFGVTYDGLNPPVGSEEGLGMVDFA